MPIQGAEREYRNYGDLLKTELRLWLKASANDISAA